MFTQLNKAQRKFFVSAALVLTLVSVFVARTAFAKLAANTVDPVALVAENGRQILLTGPISCTEGERVDLRVIVTQRSTGAIAEGHAIVIGTGALQQWEVRAIAEGEANFEEGPATAVALARSTFHGRATDAHQWLVNVTLFSE